MQSEWQGLMGTGDGWPEWTVSQWGRLRAALLRLPCDPETPERASGLLAEKRSRRLVSSWCYWGRQWTAAEASEGQTNAAQDAQLGAHGVSRHLHPPRSPPLTHTCSRGGGHWRHERPSHAGGRPPPNTAPAAGVKDGAATAPQHVKHRVTVGRSNPLRAGASGQVCTPCAQQPPSREPGRGSHPGVRPRMRGSGKRGPPTRCCDSRGPPDPGTTGLSRVLTCAHPVRTARPGSPRGTRLRSSEDPGLPCARGQSPMVAPGARGGAWC